MGVPPGEKVRMDMPVVDAGAMHMKVGMFRIGHHALIRGSRWLWRASARHASQENTQPKP